MAVPLARTFVLIRFRAVFRFTEVVHGESRRNNAILLMRRHLEWHGWTLSSLYQVCFLFATDLTRPVCWPPLVVDDFRYVFVPSSREGGERASPPPILTAISQLHLTNEQLFVT